MRVPQLIRSGSSAWQMALAVVLRRSAASKGVPVELQGLTWQVVCSVIHARCRGTIFTLSGFLVFV